MTLWHYDSQSYDTMTHKASEQRIWKHSVKDLQNYHTGHWTLNSENTNLKVYTVYHEK